MQHIARVMLLAAACGCAGETESTQPLRSDTSLANAAISYHVTKFPANLGGTQSRGTAINRVGLVAGFSNLADGTRHGAIWRNGAITDLETLGGPGSSVPWPGLNDAGMVVGISQTDRVDPLDEDWSCEAGGFLLQATNLICRLRVGEQRHAGAPHPRWQPWLRHHWPDAFPSSGAALQRAARVSGEAALLRRAERWRPWRGYAAGHLAAAAW
jgi:probable HAF family extracellular repeat protein